MEALAQNLPVKNYTVNDGLPSNRIRAFLKDSKGNLYIGTSSGLVTYDGTKFNSVTDNKTHNSVYTLHSTMRDGWPPENTDHYLKADKYWPQFYQQNHYKEFTIRQYKSADRGYFIGTSGLLSQDIFSLTEDNNGNIWIGTFTGGVTKYDGKNFTTYTTADGLPDNNVRKVWYSAKFDLLFIGTTSGCCVFNGKQFTSFVLYNHYENGYVDVMAFSENEDYIAIYPFNDRILKYYPRSESLIIDSTNFSYTSSTYPLVLPNNDTVFGYKRKGVIIKNKDYLVVHDSIGQVFDLKTDNSGNVWIAAWMDRRQPKSPGGLYMFDGKNVISYNEKTGIEDHEVWSLYFDSKTDVLWVGTLNKGIFRLELSGIVLFNNLPAYSISELNDTIIIGSKSKLLSIDHHNNIKILYNQRREALSYPEISDNDNFSTVLVDKSQNIYACGYQTQLLVLKKADNYCCPTFNNNISFLSFFAFANDSIFCGDAWQYALEALSLNAKSQSKSYFIEENRSSPCELRGCISKNDTVWYYSITKGLYRSINGRFTHLNRENPLLPVSIKTVYADDTEHIIMVANSGEIIIAKRNSSPLKIIKRLQPNKDFYGDAVTTIVTDKQHNLYVLTNKGLNIVSITDLHKGTRQTLHFLNNIETGLIDISANTSYCDNHNNIWIGTNSRLIKIDTKQLAKFINKKSHVEIQKVTINYNKTLSVTDVKLLKVDKNEDNLIFSLSSNNLYNPSDDLYRFKLSGLLDKWSPYTPDNRVIFNSLPPGKYTLQVQAYNKINNAVIYFASKDILIPHPWYTHPATIIISSLFLLAAIAVAFHARLKFIKRQETKRIEVAKKLANLEMRALQSQMNPHFVFNCINSIQGLILSKKIDEALGYLLDFSKILRNTLDNASRETISLTEEIQYIKYYLKLEMMRFDIKLDLKIEIPDAINTNLIRIPPMILQPHIENALNHGLRRLIQRKPHLTIELIPDNNKYLIIIEDNGIGRQEAKKYESDYSGSHHNSLGIQITNERFELLNKSYNTTDFSIRVIDNYDNKGLPAGTRVEITIPNQEEALHNTTQNSTSSINAYKREKPIFET